MCLFVITSQSMVLVKLIPVLQCCPLPAWMPSHKLLLGNPNEACGPMTTQAARSWWQMWTAGPTATRAPARCRAKVL